MVKYLYAVWDTVRSECNAPFVANNDAHALRVHQHSLKEVPPEYQNELELYKLGEIVIDTMEITAYAPEVVPKMALVEEEEENSAGS